MIECARTDVSPTTDPTLRSLYEQHLDGLLVFARGLVADRSLAEDAVHQAFASLVGSDLRGVANVRAYLYGAVRNAALKMLRTEERRERTWTEAVAAGRWAIFEQPTDQRESAAALDAAIAGLVAAEREVVLLKVWGGLTFNEIGEAMKTSPNTAATRYRNALGRLRDHLRPRGWP